MKKLLVVYTGGTIGMLRNNEGTLVPFEFSFIYKYLPVIKDLNVELSYITLNPIIDSSNLNTEIILKILEIIENNYHLYNGFIILHGTDTMAYTASALSFLIENLKKPIILTGSQLPISLVRTDAKENFLTSIIIASETINNYPVVPEVCIFFENKLFRGNRTIKYSSKHFNAFISPNYPELAYAGIEIEYNLKNIIVPNYKSKTIFYKKLCNDIGVLYLFPGIKEEYIKSIIDSDLKAIVLLTYGSGNAPTYRWFIEILKKGIINKKIIVNVSQCIEHYVKQGGYETSKFLRDIGVIECKDMTTEAVITKLMFLLGNYDNIEFIKEQITKNLRGELTE